MSHLLASIICTTLTYCLKSMKPHETHKIVQGTVLSILFALSEVSATSLMHPGVTGARLTYLAISIAPALHGVVQICEAMTGILGCAELVSLPGWKEDGMRRGEEKERRYSAMKKSSLKTQTINSTLCPSVSSTYQTNTTSLTVLV